MKNAEKSSRFYDNVWHEGNLVQYNVVLQEYSGLVEIKFYPATIVEFLG